MAGNSRIAGTLFFALDGTRYSAVGEFAYRVSGSQRETMKGVDGIHGFKEIPSQGRIEGKIRDGQDVSVQALNRLVNVTVTLELANGKTVIGRNMWQVSDEGAPKVSTDDAEIELALEGPDVRDQ